MTTKFNILIFVVVAACVVNTAGFARENPVTGQAIARLIASSDPDSLEGTLDEFGAEFVDSIVTENFYLIDFPPEVPIEQILQALQNNPHVDFAEPNFELELPETFQISISFPDDNPPPHVSGISPPEFYGQPAMYSIGVDSAQLLSEGSGMHVAIIDNGLDFSHPLFAGALGGPGFDYLDNDDNAGEDTGAVYGHGTFVAGLTVLTAPGCQITPLRAFNGDGYGTSFAVAQSIIHAIDHGMDIINMSFGLFEYSQMIAATCSSAVDAGIILVAAAGNGGSDQPAYPAALPGVIAVSAVDTTELLAAFSNYGDHIDICAPGVDLYSALAGEFEWGTWSGTSFAAPIVSGVCALAQAVNGSFSPYEMEAHLRQTASIDLAWGTIDPPSTFYGHGLLDAYSATLNASNTVTQTDCGDINGDEQVNTGDVIFLISHIFGGGPGPEPPAQGDVNCDLMLNVSDPVHLIGYIFRGGPDPCCAE